MELPINLLLAIGRAALNAAGVGLMADVVEIAKAAWEDWQASPDERIEELEAVVLANTVDLNRGVAEVVSRIASNEPLSVRMKLVLCHG